MAWQRISPEVNVKSFKSAVSLKQWKGLMMMSCGVTVRRRGVLGVSGRKMKALIVKMETVTLPSTGRYEGWNFNTGNYLFTTDTK